jgi:hypothetical protein
MVARAPVMESVRMPSAPSLPVLPTPVLAVPAWLAREPALREQGTADPAPRSLSEAPAANADLSDVETAPLEGRPAVKRALETVRDRGPGQVAAWNEGGANGYVTVLAPSPDRPECTRYRITRNDQQPMEIRFLRRCNGALSD